MTEQYAFDAINMRGIQPINRTTPDATPLLVLLDSLTGDGQSLTVFINGGGSDPAAPDVNNYVVTAQTTFTRDAGVVSIGTPSISVTVAGAAVAFAFTFAGDLCQLSITGPAFPYNHRLSTNLTRY